MKSQQRAETKFHHPFNRSTAKMQYSFGREKRFKQKSYLASLNVRFYDLPSQISRITNAFGFSKRTEFACANGVPPPNYYNPKQIVNKSAINFAPGRQQCKANSVFNTTTIAYPGPGNYNPEVPKEKSCITIKGKTTSKYETISPGPKYYFDSGLLDCNKILSKDKRKGSVRIVQPTNRSRIKTEGDDVQTNNFLSLDGFFTKNGSRHLGSDGHSAFMTRERRFISSETKKIVPGPGAYPNFSEFIEEAMPKHD